MEVYETINAAPVAHSLGLEYALVCILEDKTHHGRELGIGPNQGKRYSWGYPAIPDLADHGKVFELLPAASEKLGLSLSTAFQLIPEQSTAAIIVHHKDAKYYSVGESRVEQLTR